MKIIDLFRAHILSHASAALKIKNYALAKEISIAKHAKISPDLIRLLTHKELVKRRLENSTNTIKNWYYSKAYSRICRQEQELLTKLMKYQYIALKANIYLSQDRPLLLPTLHIHDHTNIENIARNTQRHLFTIENHLNALTASTPSITLLSESITDNIDELLGFRTAILKQLENLNDLQDNISTTESLQISASSIKDKINDMLEKNAASLHELVTFAINDFTAFDDLQSNQHLILAMNSFVTHLANHGNQHATFESLTTLQSRLSYYISEEEINKHFTLMPTELNLAKQELIRLSNNQDLITDQQDIVRNFVVLLTRRQQLIDLQKFIFNKNKNNLTSVQLMQFNQLMAIANRALANIHTDLQMLLEHMETPSLFIVSDNDLTLLREAYNTIQVQNSQHSYTPVSQEIITRLESLTH